MLTRNCLMNGVLIDAPYKVACTQHTGGVCIYHPHAFTSN